MCRRRKHFLREDKADMKIIGITGGIGAGKSEILQYIRKHYQCEIYLADEVAHQVKQPGTEGYHRLIALLGEEVLAPDGQIDKRRMADRIFADEAVLAQVNGILHPAVREFLLERIRQAREAEKTELFFVEAALLIECGYAELLDEMWYVYASEEVRRRRLRQNRGYSDEKISSIMQKQLREEEFRRHCDFVIDNSKTLEDSYRQIDRKLEAFTWQE